MNRYKLFVAVSAVGMLALSACSGTPQRTASSSSESVEQTQGGGEVRRQTTESSETSGSGVQTVERTENTQTSPATPAQ